MEENADVRAQPLLAPYALSAPADAQARLARWTWPILSLLVLAAFAIRVYNVGSFPDTVLADEADNAQSAVRILYNQPPANGFFGLDWTSQPAFSVYKEAAFISIFGFNIMAMRLPSAVISALTLIPFYLLLRRQLSAVASLLATILLATDVWYLNFSRSGWNCIDICFYMLMAMLFLVLALSAMTSANSPRWLKWVHFAAAGFFCALGLYGYPAGRAITLAVAAFFPIALLFNRKYWRTLLLGYLLLFAVETLVFAPEGVYIARNWDLFTGRSNVVIIMNSPDYKADPVGTMLRQLDKNIRGPWDGRVNNTPQYSPGGEPQLDTVTGLLVLVGMSLTLVIGRLRGRPETWLWWLMLLAGWVLTQLITVGTPNGARGIGYMPTLVFFAGVSLDTIVLGLTHIPTRVGWVPVARRLSFAALVVAILLVGYANVKHYIDWQNTPHTRVERYLYVTEREFPDWSTTIAGLARNKGGTMNVGQWREAHPVQDRANPYGTSP
jgi:4-amino-4-deoxy-L-arabinose transferase-like glycosyltransferase